MSCWLFSLPVHAAGKIYISTGEYPPYTAKEFPGQGCVNQLISDIYATQGLQVKFIFMPWKRAYIEAKKGNFQASSYWFDSDERRADFMFPDQYVTIERNFFYYPKKVPFDWNEYADMRGRTIVINQGYTYSDAFNEALVTYGVEQIVVTKNEQNFQMLITNRANLTIMGEKTSRVYLEQLTSEERNQIVQHPKPPIVSKGFLLISQSTKVKEKIRSAFNRGYIEVMSDKKYREKYTQECSPL
ncbi:substrate-binding periplasmic protein [Algicola sagamiensis]|uniref:substrate-binding periplasmic protein n=1 Tax=Algicola sagamiensis TaxID=163869 RepID=UPI00146C7FEE|nr:transporter substrate-binding domain-containing protein [Algicola sagamiensis]